MVTPDETKNIAEVTASLEGNNTKGVGTGQGDRKKFIWS